MGESNVGKTSIITRFVQGKFDEYQQYTIGAAFCRKSLEMGGYKINYEIWDLYPGRFKYPSPMFFRGAKVAIAVFDVTTNESFQELQNWIDRCKQQTWEKEIVIAIAANKCDSKHNHQVDMNEVRKYAQEQDCVLFETSAKDGINITEMFEEMGQRAADKQMNLSLEINGFSLNEDIEENSSVFNCWR